MIKAFLFDLDDTLFDHRGCARLALRHLCEVEACFSKLPYETLEREYHRILEEYHLKVLAGEQTLEDSRRERFRLLLELALSRLLH
jgi:FMN phosphatase YigB (HAD superfamily)